MDDIFTFKGVKIKKGDDNEPYFLVLGRIAFIFFRFPEETRQIIGMDVITDNMIDKLIEFAMENASRSRQLFFCKFFTQLPGLSSNLKDVSIGFRAMSKEGIKEKFRDYIDNHINFISYGAEQDIGNGDAFMGFLIQYRNTVFGSRKKNSKHFKSTVSFEGARRLIGDEIIKDETLSGQLKEFKTLKMINDTQSGSYSKLPKCISLTKSVLNIKNKNDNMCLVWSVLAHKFPSTSNPCLISSYRQHLKTLKIDNISFPVREGDIKSFSIDNKLSIRLWEIDIEQGKIWISSETMAGDPEDIINLLLYNNHISLIKKLDTLISFFIESRVFICQYCARCVFHGILALERHISICNSFPIENLIQLPTKKFIKFTNTLKRERVPIVIYADFECMLVPCNIQKGLETKIVSNHVPIAFGVAMFFMGRLHEIYKCSENVSSEFVDVLLELSDKIKNEYDNLNSMTETRKGKCKICSKIGFCLPFKSLLTGNYMGNAHFECRKSYYNSLLKIPVLFHNLKGYDSHLFIDELVKKTRYFSCIPISREKYISFNCVTNLGVKLRFLDSMSFLTGSLASNADRLSSFKFIGKEISNMPTLELKDLNKKLPFPYEYITSFEVLRERTLPTDKESWYSKLKGTSPSAELISEAHHVFNKLKCKKIEDYMKVYLRVDVLLLSEVFEAFRDIAISDTSLDPLNYFTTPGLAWDAALSKSRQSLELMSDPELVSFFTSKGSIRGGISSVSELKYHEITNASSIHYFDVTNLYGYAMTFKLPVGNFKKISTNSNEEIMNIITKWDINDEIGYIFEVDIDYPSDLSDKHNALPFLVEHINGKLIPCIRDKKNYHCHIIILKQAIMHGLILRRVIRAYSFTQKAWLKEYVTCNTIKRTQTKDEAMRNYYKLMNNAVYGKTMENILNRSSCKIVDIKDTERIDRIINKENVEDVLKLTDNILLYSCRKQPPIFDKPVYVGFSILEISKYHMYSLLYDTIKIKWPFSKLMYMDTDSLIVAMDSVKIDYNNVKSKFDLSAYNDDRREVSNKGVLGTLKDEYPNDPIVRFVCLKSKCYALVTQSGKVTMKNKGVTRMDSLTFDDYMRVLESEIKGDDEVIKVEQFTFRSFNHKIFSIVSKKVCLKSSDDKRSRPNDKYVTKALT